MADEPNNSTGNPPPTNPPPASGNTEPGRDRIADLRAELAAERVAKRDLEAKLTSIQADAEKVRKEADTKVQEAVTKSEAKAQKLQQRIIDAELRIVAKEVGLKDADLLLHPLLDRSGIKLDDEGNVTGVKEAFEALKAKKPDWFATQQQGGAAQQTQQGAASERTTGGAAPPPGSGSPRETDVRKMTPQEYDAYKRNLLRDMRTRH